MLGLVGHEHAGEHLGHVVDMDRAAHRVLEREADRLAARRLGDDVHVVDRAAHLVRAGDVRRADAGNLHAQPVVPLCLVLVVNLRSGVDTCAKAHILLR